VTQTSQRVVELRQTTSARQRHASVARSDPWIVAAGVAALGLAVLAFYGDRVAPHESIFFVVEHGADLRPYDPGVVFPLGSDILGRDLLSIVLAGARSTIGVVVLGGLARVCAGVTLAALGDRWRPLRGVTDTAGDFVAAIPATLVALVILKVLVKTGDASLPIFVSVLLLTGWAGPYRVIRSELDRLARAPFTEGAASVGLRPWRVFWRHHLPHLVPTLAINTSQQIVATLVLVAELGVLGAFVGSTRVINIEESLRVVRTGPVNFAQLADPPEWGGLLASARTVDALWTTRWLILVPGVAFAVLAACIALIGFAVARRYARRDLVADFRHPAAAAFVVVLAAMWIVAGLLPPSYAAAGEWAAATRSVVAGTSDLPSAFAQSRLAPLGSDYAITRSSDTIVQNEPASATIAGTVLTEPWPRKIIRLPDRGLYAQALLTADSGGGSVDAPLVFAARGISHEDYPPQPLSPFRTTFTSANQDFGSLIRDYADDWAGIDVRGKVVLLVRFVGVNPPGGVRASNPLIAGPAPEVSIANAIKRGAAAVLFVDPLMPFYEATYRGQGTLVDPYARLEQESPAQGTAGVPVLVLSPAAAQRLLAGVDLDVSSYLGADDAGAARTQSGARELGVRATVSVPLTTQQGAKATSVAGMVSDVPATEPRILVWTSRTQDARHPTTPVLANLARVLGSRHSPLVFVEFDPTGDRGANLAAMRETLAREPIALVLVIAELDGTALRFTTPYGDLIPAIDLYAQRAGARYEVTRGTALLSDLAGIAPLIDRKTILIRGNGGDGDLRPDALALIGYLAGRQALGAEELR
jgi:peptide/nickel transport system permease protein